MTTARASMPVHGIKALEILSRTPRCRRDDPLPTIKEQKLRGRFLSLETIRGLGEVLGWKQPLATRQSL